jgi:hypothetical protein
MAFEFKLSTDEIREKMFGFYNTDKNISEIRG